MTHLDFGIPDPLKTLNSSLDLLLETLRVHSEAVALQFCSNARGPGGPTGNPAGAQQLKQLHFNLLFLWAPWTSY